MVCCALAGSNPAAEPAKDGLTDDERVEYAELKDFRPHASEGFRAWFFDFGPGPAEEGYTKVLSTDIYTSERGWGWVYDVATQKAIRGRAGFGDPYGYTYVGNNTRRPFRDKYRIYTPLEVDHMGAFRRYGVILSGLNDRGDLDRSMNAAQYIKDDACAEFWVDVPPGEYSLILEADMEARGQPVVQVQNENVHVFQARGNPKTKALFVPVKDGPLKLKLRADRFAACHNSAGIWGLGPGWSLCYVAIFDARDEPGFFREEWRIIKNKYFHAKKEIYVNLNRLQARVEDFHIVLDERPHWDIHLQNHFLPEVDKYLRFYSLGNALGGGGALMTPLKKLLTSNNYLAADRHEKSYYEDYPFELIEVLNTAYSAGFLARPFFGGEQLEFMPKYLQGESPLMSSPDGRSLGRAPLGSKLQQELIREFLEFLSAHISDHPSLLGYELWEELEDMPGHYGYDAESVLNYQTWLEAKHGDIGRLNQVWKTAFAAFSEIVPPPYATYGGANYTSWQEFRGKIQGDNLQLCRNKIRELQPWTLAVGGGARPTTGDDCTWDWLRATDVTFQYGTWLQKMMPPAQAYRAARDGQQVAVQSKTVKAGSSRYGGTSRNCPFTHFFSGIHRKGQSLRGRSSLQRTPEETQRAVDACNGYNSILHGLFHGMKSIMWESQESFPDTHMVHYSKWYSDVLSKPGGEFRNEYNDLIFFAPQALEGPPVRICLPFLYAQRANELVQRAAGLLLPARPMGAEVGLLATAASTYPVGERYTPGLSAFRFPLNNLSELLDSLQTPAWGIREDIFDDVFKYKLIIAGPSASAVTGQQAEKLKQFVAKGGYLVVINNGCSQDGDTLYAHAESPILGLDKLVGGKVEKCDGHQYFELRAGQEEGQTYAYESITPYQGSAVLQKDGEAITAVRSADGHGVLILDKRFGESYYEDIERDAMDLRSLLSEVLKAAAVRGWVTIEGAAEPWQIYAGALEGKDHWTFAILNNGLENQALTAKIRCLPAGEYSVIDITGQRPLLKFTPEKSWHLVPDPEYKRERFLAARISAAELAEKGLQLDCVSKGGRILLVRNVQTDVWVNLPRYEMTGLTYQYHRKDPAVDKRLDARPERVPVRIVLGAGAPRAQTDAASEIAGLLRAKGINAQVVSDRDVTIKATETKVEVPTVPHGSGKGTDVYLMDVFHNQVIDTDGNLIVIGNENTNSVVKQLAKDGAYAYDKVLIKVSETFPGAGIGVIQAVESVNNEAYDARHESRSAILIGGSDEPGTTKALERFLAEMRAGAEMRPAAEAAKYGFGQEKRPVYVKPRKKSTPRS